MHPAQHAYFQSLVSAFRQQFQSDLNHDYSLLQRELETWKATALVQFDERLGRVQTMLAGPYDKELEWDWVPDDCYYSDARSCIENRRVRLRENPEFEISGREFCEKYGKSALGVIPLLAAAGFYTPPPSKFFLLFCKQLIDGSKLLLRLEDLRKIYVPMDQIDIAFRRSQELIATNRSLQGYCPLGIPLSATDKQFYLDVVNSLVGLPYKVVLPLSEEEIRAGEGIKTLILSEFCEKECVEEELASLEKALRTGETAELRTSGYFALLSEYQARIRLLASN
jgi:hypothetical protein